MNTDNNRRTHLSSKPESVSETSRLKSQLASCLAGLPTEISDWEGFVRVASAELLLPALAGKIPDVDGFLSAVLELNRERNLRLLDDAREIAAVFNAIDIEPVLLKGAAYLVAGIYDDMGARYVCDLDLLVPAASLDEAADALIARGYVPDSTDAMARFRHHYPQLQKPGESSPVELHHSIGAGVSRRILSGEEMVRDSQAMEWRGVRVRVPSPEHLATHLIVHSQVHHAYSEKIWPPLRALYDLSKLSSFFGNLLDWEAVRARFRKRGKETTLLLHLLQAQAVLGISPAFAFELGWVGRLRWQRRRILNRWPGLRFVDPVYVAMASLSRRMQFLKSAAGSPGGLREASGMLLRPGFYRRLLGEISLR